MPKEKNAAATPFYRELLQFGVYKRSQGKIARQITFAALALTLVLGVWRSVVFLGKDSVFSVWFAAAALIVGLWISFRLVNMPSFADFLIAVEAEMNKVSWPTRTELLRSSIVVIFSIFFLAAILFGYDLFWRAFLTFLGIGHR